MENKDLGKTTTGIQPNVAALLTYILGWVSGLVFFLIEKENKFVRFHAMQSIVVFGALSILTIALGVVPGVGIMLAPIVYIVELIAWVILMVKAYQGEKFKLPVAGDVAEKHA